MTAIDDPAAPVARHPRREAQEVVGDAFEARVLEPWAARWLGAWRRLPPLPPASTAPSRTRNSTSFRGAILPFARLVDADDQRPEALAFLRRGRALLER